jgi:hypothetical protein
MPKVHEVGVGTREMTTKESDAYNEKVEREKKEAEEYLKVKYKDDRRSAYPEIGDQLDDLYKKGLFSDEMSIILSKVKSDFPKPK